MKQFTRTAIILLACLAALLGQAGFCNTIYVTAGGTGDGSSWGNALGSLIDAYSAAASGDEVWVARGTYNEYIELAEGVKWYGGFVGTETSLSQRPGGFPRDKDDVNATVLDSDYENEGAFADYGLTNAAVFDGFVIRHCMAGLDSYGSPIIRNNTITECGGYGDPVSFDDWGSPIFTNNLVIGNSASQGVINVSYGSPVITNNIIASNQGMCAILLGTYATARVENNTISQCYYRGIFNYSTSRIANNVVIGSMTTGIYTTSGPTIVGNTIVGCTDDYGGAINLSNSTAHITNNIVAFNASGIAGGGGNPQFSHNCVYNPDSFNYDSNFTNHPTDIQADPLLEDWQFGRLHLKTGSPCIDAGDNTPVLTTDADLDLLTRKVDGNNDSVATVDIGADEYDGTSYEFSPQVFRVDGTSGNDANDGSSWTSAKATVQSAIDAASEVGGGEVWVKAGLYQQNLTVSKPHISLYGGFAGNEEIREGRNPKTNTTILDGGGNGSVVTYHTLGHKLNTLDGFTIRNGSATNGGGVNMSQASAYVTNNVITGNHATSGGGIRVYNGGAVIENNVISNNTATDGAGLNGVRGAILSNLFLNNTATGNGGGIYTYGGCLVTNNTIVGNSAAVGGGYWGADLSVANNIIAGNSSGVYGGWGVPSLKNNCVYGNTSYDYGGFSPVPTGTNGNISTDPMFANSSGSDYRLTSSSPCKDTGTNSAQGIPALDLDGTVRVLPTSSGIVDMGAYEYDSTAPSTPVVTDDGEYATSLTTLHASWTSSDAESGVVEYQYAIGTGSDATGIVGWTSAGSQTSVTRSDLSLIDGSSYYFSVKAKNRSGVWSAVGVSDGIMVLTSGIRGAKMLTNGSSVSMTGVVVSAVFSGYYYVQETNRSCGIMVIGSTQSVSVGTQLDLTGHVGTSTDGERYVADPVISIQTGSVQVKPLGISDRGLGGGAFGLQSGVAGGSGWNNIGLLMRIWGTVTYVDATNKCFWVDDGGLLNDGSTHRGVKVSLDSSESLPSSVVVGGHIAVTGASSCFSDGTSLQRLLRIRSQSEVTALNTVVTVGTTLYPAWGFVTLPSAPVNPDPEWVFRTDTGSSIPVNAGSLGRFDAWSGGYTYFNHNRPAGFGGMVLGTGYTINSASQLLWQYDAFMDGMPDSDGMTDMSLNLPGGWGGGAYHLIGLPFNHSVNAADCLFTNGVETKTWAQAYGTWFAYCYCWDNQTGNHLYVGVDASQFDLTQFEPYKGYWMQTSVENLAMILPAGTSGFVPDGALADPQFDPQGGLYYTAKSVAITTTSSGAAIHYTTNGNDPTNADPLYTSPITVEDDLTLKAKAWKLNSTPSGVATASYLIHIDTTPPSTPVVTDSGAFTTTLSSIHASWTSSDAESGIAQYQYAIGTAPYPTTGWDSVAGWTTVGAATEATRSGLSLSDGVTYYISAKAANGAGLWSDVGVSDGILAKTLMVVDDGDVTGSTSMIHASIITAQDYDEYKYAISTNSDGSDPVVGWQSNEENKEILGEDLQLTADSTYYVAAQGRTGQTWSPVRVTDGITVALAAQKRFYVKDTASAPASGVSWQSPTTLADALGRATAESEIWVAKGSYAGPITVRSGLRLYGGFAGMENTLGERPSFPRPDPDPNESSIVGGTIDSSGYGFNGTVVTVRGAGTNYASTVVDGFHITGGSGWCLALGYTTIAGGVNCSGAATIINNRITGNRAQWGGGVYAENTLVEGNRIEDNHAGAGLGYFDGAGLYIKGGECRDNIIVGNGDNHIYQYQRGGGLFVGGLATTIVGNVISSNSAVQGGGIYEYVPATLVGNIISSNSADEGGGVYYKTGGCVTVNNTIVGNSQDVLNIQLGGFGVNYFANNIIAFNASNGFALSGPAMFYNNCLYGNTCCDYYAPNYWTGNINIDPGFVNRTTGDYHLTSSSACVGTGEPSPSYCVLPDKDVYGAPRVRDGAVDIGAAQFWAIAAPVFVPEPGLCTAGQAVRLSCPTPGVTIRYTVDGTTPTWSSRIYSQPIVIDQTKTIKANAWFSSTSGSSVTSTGTYVIADPVNGTSQSLTPEHQNESAGVDRSNIRWGNAAPGTGYASEYAITSNTTINTIRMWAVPNVPAYPVCHLGDHFSSVTLRVIGVNPSGAFSGVVRQVTGTFTLGTNTTSNPDISVSPCYYADGSSYQCSDGTSNQLWRIDFKNLNLPLSIGNYAFAITGTPRVDRIWFSHASIGQPGSNLGVWQFDCSTLAATRMTGEPWIGGKPSVVNLELYAE